MNKYRIISDTSNTHSAETSRPFSWKAMHQGVQSVEREPSATYKLFMQGLPTEECSTKTALDLGQVCDKGSDVWN